jgi:hypothetical protein
LNIVIHELIKVHTQNKDKRNICFMSYTMYIPDLLVTYTKHDVPSLYPRCHYSRCTVRAVPILLCDLKGGGAAPSRSAAARAPRPSLPPQGRQYGTLTRTQAVSLRERLRGRGGTGTRPASGPRRHCQVQVVVTATVPRNLRLSLNEPDITTVISQSLAMM